MMLDIALRLRLAAVVLAFSPALTGSADAEPTADLPPLDLAALLREAEEQNPDIAAARQRRLAAETIPSQVQSLPDPLASVAYTNDTISDLTLGDSEFSALTFAWTQEVPYPGKLRLSGEVARREVEIWARRVEQARLEVASALKRAFADLYRVDRTSSILGESRILLVSFRDTARARYESGDGLLENVLKAQTEISRLDAQLETLEQERVSLHASLNALAGHPGNRPLGPAVELPTSVPSLDLASLEQDALTRSPEVLGMQASALRGESRLDLAKRQTKPDLMWGAAYQYRGDLDPMVMGMFGLRLPLFRERKQVQGIVQAERELDAARQDVASSKLKIAFEVRELVARVGRTETLAQLYAEGVIPQARAALESAAASYGVGRVDLLTLLSDFSTLLTYEVEYEAQRAERVSVLASLERLTARVLVPVAGEPDSTGFPHE